MNIFNDFSNEIIDKNFSIINNDKGIINFYQLNLNFSCNDCFFEIFLKSNLGNIIINNILFFLQNPYPISFLKSNEDVLNFENFSS